MAGFPAPGDHVGPYEVAGEVGRGPLGVVLRARDTRNGAAVTLKVLSPATEVDAGLTERMTREFEIVQHLRSPQLLAPGQFGWYDGRLVLVAPYLPHGNLAARIADQPVDRETAVATVSTLAALLDAAHADGVVHGAVKPTNVLIGGLDGASPVLADFDGGLRDAAWQRPPGVGEVDAYAAPEQQAGGRPSVAGDVYGLGAVLHALLTGRAPGHGAVVPVSEPGLAEVLDRALADDPALRFASAAAMGEALAGALVPRMDAEALHDPIDPVAVRLADEDDQVAAGMLASAPSAPWSGRRKLIAVAAVAVVAAVVAAGSLLLGNDDDSAPQAGGDEVHAAPALTDVDRPSPPEVTASPAYRAVRFSLEAAESEQLLEVNRGGGWRRAGATVRMATEAGGERACLRARTSVETESGPVTSKVVRSCGRSAPPELRAVRVTPDCNVAGFIQVCYRLEARGFTSGNAETLVFEVGGRDAGTATIPIDADGRGTLPDGQTFHFADSDAGQTARISMAGATYTWQVASR